MRSRLTVRVLGSAAGGGVPQWNCSCPVCRLAWAGDPRVTPRTQTSLAVSVDRKRWLLLNASPDLRTQILHSPALQPAGSIRASPIEAVLLTGAEIDQTAGLLSLREGGRFVLLATAATHAELASPMFGALSDIERRTVTSGARVELAGISLELFSVPGKVPLYRERRTEIGNGLETTVGVAIETGNAPLLFIPSAADITPHMMARMRGAGIILFDGTLYKDDELIDLGIGAKTGRRMGHMPIDGPDGSLAALADIAGRRIYVHLNNTNPVLIEGSVERQRVEAAGWEIAKDGLELEL